MNTVTFGDSPAASLLEIATRCTAEMNAIIHWLLVKEDRYVDDLSAGGTLGEVAYLMGKEGTEFQQDG